MNEMVKWEEELAKEAAKAASSEAAFSGGQFFSTRGGQLSWQDAPLPGNQMLVVILDYIFETSYFEDRYNPDVPQTPSAFALGRDQSELRWHEDSAPEFAGKLCRESEVCEWGSADTGKGKAARESRRLAMIPAGSFDKSGGVELIEDPAHFATTPVGYMKLPVTSVKGFANFVCQVAEVMNRPPFGIVTRVAVVPDAKTQFKVVFEAVSKIPAEIIPTILKRRPEVMATIDFPYARAGEEVGQVEEKTPAMRRRARKY